MTLFSGMSKIRKIVVIVFGIHFLFVFAMFVHHFFWKEMPKKRIFVRTIPQQMITPSVLVKSNTEKQSAGKGQGPVKKTQVPVKKSIPKTGTVPAAKNKGARPLVKAKSEELPTSKIKTKSEEISIPILKTMPDELKVTAPNISKNEEVVCEDVPSYGQTLIAYLQGSLDLPEIGEVKVELEIDCFGKLVHFEILEEKSKKNSEFLKKRLPELVLPCFNDSSHENAVFTITFKNSLSTLR